MCVCLFAVTSKHCVEMNIFIYNSNYNKTNNNNTIVTNNITVMVINLFEISLN